MSIIPMRDVASGHISKLGHHEGNLYVQFSNGDRYRYEGVPTAVYERAFAPGASAGKWLHSEVKGKFKHTKLEKAQ